MNTHNNSSDAFLQDLAYYYASQKDEQQELTPVLHVQASNSVSENGYPAAQIGSGPGETQYLEPVERTHNVPTSSNGPLVAEYQLNPAEPVSRERRAAIERRCKERKREALENIREELRLRREPVDRNDRFQANLTFKAAEALRRDREQIARLNADIEWLRSQIHVSRARLIADFQGAGNSAPFSQYPSIPPF